jgi:ferritin-like metal-binding protein YciE
MQLNNLHDVLIEQLADLYSAETQLLSALPKMAGAAHSAELRQAFTEHLEETRRHVGRLDEAFGELSVPRSTETCEAMRGLIEEGSEIVEATGDPAAIDAALIAAAQRVEHYEISAYGTVRALAGELGYDRAAALLDETLAEEARADKLLTKLAAGGFLRSGINEEAASRS